MIRYVMFKIFIKYRKNFNIDDMKNMNDWSREITINFTYDLFDFQMEINHQRFLSSKSIQKTFVLSRSLLNNIDSFLRVMRRKRRCISQNSNVDTIVILDQMRWNNRASFRINILFFNCFYFIQYVMIRSFWSTSFICTDDHLLTSLSFV